MFEWICPHCGQKRSTPFAAEMHEAACAANRHEQKKKADAKVTQAERAVLEAAKEWFDDYDGDDDALIQALHALEAAEREQDALNASTVGEERED